MALKLNSGKFLLKLIVIGGSALLLLILLMQAFLQWQFDEARIQASLTELIAPTGRTLTFEQGIKTSWLPRPTVTLKQVKLSEPYSLQTAASAQELDLGISWWSVFSGGKLTNISFKQADLRLNQNQDGTWSIEDLFQIKSKQTDMVDLNYIAIENSNIEVGQTNAQIPFRVEDINLSITSLDRTSGYLKASATLLQGAHRINLQIDSPTRKNDKQISLPELSIKANSRMIQYGQTALNIQTKANYFRAQKQLILQDLKATFNTESPVFTASASIPVAKITPKESAAAIINMSARLEQADVVTKWVMTLEQNQFNNQILKVNNAKLQTEIKTPQHSLTINTHSKLELDTNGQYLFDNLSLTTRLLAPKRPTAKLESNLTGVLRGTIGKGFELNTKGVFEGSNAQIQLTSTLNSPFNSHHFNVILDELNIGPYLALAEKKDDNSPSLLAEIFNSDQVINLDFLAGNHIEGDVNIQHLKIGQVLFKNTQAHLLAQPEGITINNIQANIYQGKLSGTFSLEAGSTPKLTLDQTLIGMNIQPLLQDLFGYHQLTGNGNARVFLTTQGKKPTQMRDALAGDISLELSKGALLGIDLTDTVHNLPAKLKAQSEERVNFDATQTTEFSQLKANIHFIDGVARNKDLKLRSDLILLTGEGKLDLKKQIVEYTMHIKANPSKMSQFKDINIPLQITGPITAPVFSLDYNTLTQGKATPEEKQKVLRKELTKQLGSFISP